MIFVKSREPIDSSGIELIDNYKEKNIFYSEF